MTQELRCRVLTISEMHIRCFSFWHHDMYRLETQPSALKFGSRSGWGVSLYNSFHLVWSNASLRWLICISQAAKQAEYSYDTQAAQMGSVQKRRIYSSSCSKQDFFPVLWLAVLADPFYLFIYFIVFLMWDPIFVCITHAKQGWRGSKDVENPKRKTLKDVLQMFNEEEGCKASVKPLVALANMHGFRFMYSTLPSDFCHEVTWRPFRTWTVWFSSEQTSR